MARTSDSGVAARFVDRAVMETLTGQAIEASQPQIDAFLADNPPPGKNLPLTRLRPGLGNLGEGFYWDKSTQSVLPIDTVATPLTEVQVLLKATGDPARPYVIQTTYPALP
jgi:hypothetical protein